MSFLCSPRQPTKRLLATVCQFVVCLSLAVSTTGCEKPPITFHEVKRIDETLSVDELAVVVHVLKTFQDEQWAALPPTFSTLPAWETNRTLSVASLLREEDERIGQLWDQDRLARKYAKNRHLQKMLSRYHINLPQFFGLVRCVVVAVSASQVPEEFDYRRQIDRASDRLRRLEMDERPFAGLSPDQQFEVQQLTYNLSRRERFTQLSQVPLANRELVTKFRKELEDVLPVEYFKDPLEPIIDWEEEYGTPFREVPGSVPSDIDLTWSRER